MSAPLLEGIRVLDLTRVLAGPYCTMMLGDLGADILKVEEPGRGDETRQWGPPFAGGESAYYLCVNRNKRSLGLNLKTEKGRQLLRQLIEQSDVLVENFRAGTLEEWGLSYEELQRLRPGLVYCTITGYGYTGPYRDRAGYDFIIQAEGGLMSITGPAEGEPYKVGVAVADITTGLFACNAILAALFARQRSGAGQRIDMALFDSQVAWLANVASNYLVSGQAPRRHGNAHPNIVPYQAFRASDGYFALAIGNDAQFQKLCSLLNHPDWATDERFASNAARVHNRQILIPLLEAEFLCHDTRHWQTEIEARGLPVGPINNLERVFENPQVAARNMRVEIDHPSAGSIPLVGSPLNIPTAPPSIRRPPPLLGQHTDEVLRELLALDDETLRSLRAEQVI